ncbi:hypothetical protein HZH68_016987 [Vespula germanica]|uniref:Glutathione S-transferase omega-1 n=2 Tax=Vespula TaxID=7451 RepID=A0A834MMK7_VESGE|nr:glutathione S-transferase omega-1-like [Vespula pensylvanica]KAF7379142.1 hypothetical protein HZH68_016987 [Vespula germanica]KAF7387599.1 hypothetical protein H0235_018321 [Vespula pensylvanica]
MSSLHLGKGSIKPAEIEGQARLYSMKFCPYAHRIRLILSIKKVPHDIVNINLKNKPEWYLEIHPEGKVPAFVDADGKVVVDSTEIANYIDKKYPLPELYHEETKSRDLELLEHYSKIIDIFSNCIHGKDSRTLDEIVDEISNLLEEFEDELKMRDTDFYGGNEPKMLDILMWPWIERAKSLSVIYKQPLNVNKQRFSKIMKWISEMRAQQFVQENACSYEKFGQLINEMKSSDVDFDAI